MIDYRINKQVNGGANEVKRKISEINEKNKCKKRIKDLLDILWLLTQLSMKASLWVRTNE